MNKRTMLLITVLFMLAPILLAGCQRSANTDKSGLNVYGWSSSLGGKDDSLDETVFSYSISLTNDNDTSAAIKTAQPVIGDKVKDKVLSEDTIIVINKELAANEAMQIEGEIIFDTKRMSKEDIDALSPFITGITIESEETIALQH